MSTGTSRSDRLGFIAFLALAALLATFVVTNLDNGPSESATQVSTFADVAPAQAVRTTEAIAMPTATPTPVPFVPAAAPALDEPEEEVEESVEETVDEADASTADGNATDEGTADTASAGTAESADVSPAPETTSTDGDVPNPQPATEAVPNPQPAAEEVPNPQLPADAAAEGVPNPQLPADAAAEEVPNPQPQEAAVPNPQPATAPVAAAPASVPADAPAGGTFTHTLTASVSRPTLHTSAGGPAFTPTFNGQALPAVNPTVFGNPLVYRVLAGAPGDAWAKVYVPARPNGTTAWVQTSQFNWGSSNRMLQINVSNNTVTVFEGSNVLLTTAAVTGKSSSRTPLANGWVEEIMAGPSSAFGPRLISLGIFSDDLNSFAGSIPKVALHGTNNPGLMGQYASNGCIRVPNDIITQIAGMMPVGSKVIITS